MSETITMNGQTALVTGATRGIGAAIALALATRGMKVTGTATSAARILSMGHHHAAYEQKHDKTNSLHISILVKHLI